MNIWQNAINEANVPQHTPHASARRPAKRPPLSEALYVRSLTVFAILVGLGGSAGLWWVGTRCTLAAMEALGVPVATWRPLAYFVPLAITAVEVGFSPSAIRSWVPRLQWALFLALDAATTALGAIWALPWMLPSDTVLRWLVAFGAEVVLALLPERLARTFVALLYLEITR